MNSHSRSVYPKWFSPELKHLVIQKKVTPRQIKETGETYFYKESKQLRHHCKWLADICYRNYADFLESTIQNIVKVFRSHIKNLETSTMPSKLNYNDAVPENPYHQCDPFADLFSSGFKYKTLLISTFDFRTCHNTHCLPAIALQVRPLSALNPFNDVRPDFIPS